MALTIKVKNHSYFTILCPDGNQIRIELNGVYGESVVHNITAPKEYVILREGVTDDRIKTTGRKVEGSTGNSSVDRESGQGGC